MRKAGSFFRAGAALFLLASPSWAAGTKINGVVYDSSTQQPGNAEAKGGPTASSLGQPADQALRLKKIFLFPSLDDVSGALAPKLDDKLAELFNRNPRFELIRDPQVIKALSPGESVYAKAAENQAVHREAARLTSADTTILLRTRNVGANSEMTLEFRDSSGNLLFSESGSVIGSAPLEARWGLIEKLFKAALANLPFEGTVTGRTANTITVDLGMGFTKQGEEVEIARIVSVQRHPLLGTVVGVDYARTGRAKVTNVDKVMSFAEILEEFPGERISPGQKVLLARASLVHRPVGEPEPATRAPGRNGKASRLELEEQDVFGDRVKGDFDEHKTRYGVVGAELAYGTLSQTQNVGTNASIYSGSGVGGTLSGELWVTREWILSLLYELQSATLSGNGATLGSTTWHNFMARAGYRLRPDAIAEGLTITGTLGYQTMDFNVPSVNALQVGGKRYSGPVIGVEGEILFLKGQKLSGGFAINPYVSFLDKGGSLGNPNGGSVISFNLGWNYLLSNALWLRLGIRYDAANENYDNSASVSDKRFAIGPGIYYSF